MLRPLPLAALFDSFSVEVFWFLSRAQFQANINISWGKHSSKRVRNAINSSSLNVVYATHYTSFRRSVSFPLVMGMGIGNATGYPGVFQGNLHPYPWKPTPAFVGTGCGFSQTHGVPAIPSCIPYIITCINNKTFVSIKKNTKKKKKSFTYGPNDTRLASFGLFLIVVTFQHPPCCVLHRL